MADLSDIEAALVLLCAGALYPAGSEQPSAVGAACRVHRGWPITSRLDADLKAGLVTVSVYAQQGVTRNVTRYRKEWHIGPAPAVTLVLTAAGSTVTVSGTAAATHVAAVAVDGKAYDYRCSDTDTPASVAAALAALIATDRPATAAGAVLTLPAARALAAHAVTDYPARREIRRQEQGFQIIVWAPSPALRDVASAAVDVTLSESEYLTLPDGSRSRLTYQRTMTTDEGTEAVLYRRDLVYLVEYATTQDRVFPAVASITRTLAPVGGEVIQTTVTVTSEG